ncbi:14638_t:CDS:2 [Dentiscutata erythropus]|uniref:14638_t:CDS:1 n=1 Tax=Dentiscutata erythropus TaxID=1348616 RepID=A0A9N8Z2U2_9GLOM|nr:14638_t:CDS:2 [Dentiscutata erythropus]
MSYNDDDGNSREIFVTFHVHLPKNFDKSMRPLVVGSIKELGNWKMPVVKLHQTDSESTYWVSDPVKLHLYSPNLDNDFRFVSVIYESVTLENFTKKVMEFQMILKHHNALTVRDIGIDSIFRHFSNAINNYQKIFACVMLAYHIETIQKQTYTLIYLHGNFPSANLLQVLLEVQADNLLPTSAKRPFTFLTSTLVRHNSSKRYSFDWMKMFSVASILDSNYTFLSHINVKPYVDKINKAANPLIYHKIIKTLITISFFGMSSCDFIINKFIGKESIDCEISDFMCDNYISKNVDFNNPYEFEQHFKSITKDLYDCQEKRKTSNKVQIRDNTWALVEFLKNNEFDWNEIEWSENLPPIYDDRTETFTFTLKPVDYYSSSVMYNYEAFIHFNNTRNTRSYDYDLHHESKVCVQKKTEKQTVVDYNKLMSEVKLEIEFSSTASPTFTNNDNMCEYKFDSQNSVHFKREIEVNEVGESISHIKLCGLTITAWKLCYVLDCLQVNGKARPLLAD